MTAEPEASVQIGQSDVEGRVLHHVSLLCFVGPSLYGA